MTDDERIEMEHVLLQAMGQIMKVYNPVKLWLEVNGESHPDRPKMLVMRRRLESRLTMLNSDFEAVGALADVMQGPSQATKDKVKKLTQDVANAVKANQDVASLLVLGTTVLTAVGEFQAT